MCDPYVVWRLLLGLESLEDKPQPLLCLLFVCILLVAILDFSHCSLLFRLTSILTTPSRPNRSFQFPLQRELFFISSHLVWYTHGHPSVKPVPLFVFPGLVLPESVQFSCRFSGHSNLTLCLSFPTVLYSDLSVGPRTSTSQCPKISLWLPLVDIPYSCPYCFSLNVKFTKWDRYWRLLNQRT